MTTTKTKRYNGEGCITQQKDGRWVARIQIGKTEDGKQKIKALYGHTKQEVVRKLKDYKQEIATGILNISKMTVSEYISRWLKLYKSTTVSASTYDRYENTFKYHIKDTIGYIQMGNITANDIQQLINEKSQDLSYSSLRKIKELLNPCFKQAEILGDIRKNPMIGVIMPNQKSMNVQTKQVDIYSDEDVKKISDVVNSTFNQKKHLFIYSPIYLFLFSTGLRMGEVLALTWDNVDFENKTVTIIDNVTYVKSRKETDNRRQIKVTTPKTQAGFRIVPLNVRAYESLNELKKRYESVNLKSQYVVSNLVGDIVLPRNFSRTFESICKRADVEYKGIHAIRHTFASRCIRLGIDVKIVSELLGHSNIQITYNRYVHIIKEQKAKAMKQLDVL